MFKEKNSSSLNSHNRIEPVDTKLIVLIVEIVTTDHFLSSIIF